MSGTPRALLDTGRGGPLSAAAQMALEAAGTAGWSDPTAPTAEGRRAADLLAAGRSSLATSLAPGPPGAGVHLLPGGGAALATGLLGLLRPGTPLVVGAIDPAAVLRVARWWGSEGHPVTVMGVDRLGRLDSPALLAAAGPGTVVALQLANGEVGTVQDAEALLPALREAGALVLLDATAAAGRIRIPEGWTALAADAASWGGPRGTGVLLTAPGAPWRAPGPALASEHPVALTVAAAAALESAMAGMAQSDARHRALTARLRTELPRLVPDLEVAGDPDRRLPHVLTASALYVDGESVARGLDAAGIAVGSGSACASDTGEPSHVLAAMGVLTGGNVRVVLPIEAVEADIDRLLAALPGVVAGLRAEAGMVTGTEPVRQDAGMTEAPAVPDPTLWLDERGKRCPAPVIALARASFTQPDGTVVAVLASDPAAGTDIPAWCRLKGAEYLGELPPRDGGEGMAYVVRTVAEA